MRIDGLKKSDVPAVSALVQKVNRDVFDGLPVQLNALSAEFSAARRDRYWGIWSGSQLLAVFFLRGMDDGFAAPAFGVAVAPDAQGRGIGRLALDFAEAWSRNERLMEIMLTVNQANTKAISLYESRGFVRTDKISSKGNLIFRKNLCA